MKEWYTILPREFYKAETIFVAKALLGKFLIRKLGDKELIGKIVETEAYLPFDDPASHNFIGKTPRNEVLFGEAGYSYVHSIHKYHCIDVVTEGIERPGSVLIRAVEPIEGTESMMKNRSALNTQNITNGPGRLCQAFQITRELNAIDMSQADSIIQIAHSKDKDISEIINESMRIGISKAKDLPLRFSIKGNAFVSKTTNRTLH